MARKLVIKDCRFLAKLVTENRAPCAFCYRKVDDEVTYGKLYAIGGIQCHYLCALLSCCLVQKGPEEEGLFGFMYKDILAELERSKKHKCSFCGRGGANLGCSVGSCRKQFHLPCGRERNAVSLFYGSYKSFCQIHAPKQRIPEHIMCKAKLRMKDDKKKNAVMTNAVQKSDEDMVCVICYEAVDAFPTVNTFWPPCCARDAWFHRSCVQRMALSAGMHYLKCPLCNDKENFYDAVVSQGYYVPDRDAAWELEQNAFAEIYERPLTCTAEPCQCPMGRSHDADQGMWDIKLCLLCGSVGAHTQCISASETTRYVCLTCTPAAPQDLQALADTIEKLIIQEQTNSANNSSHGPVMPSRMSLRRTKGRVALSNKPSSSRFHDIKTECESPVQSPNVQTSRQELNLKTPRKLIHNLQDSPMKPIQQETHENLQAKQSSNKLLEQSFNVSYKHTDSSKHMGTKQYSPLKLLQETDLNKLPDSNKSMGSKRSPIKLVQDTYSSNHTDLYKNIEARLLSPMKLLEQSFKEKVACMGRNAILDDRVMEILKKRFNKPRPLSEKKRIIEDILDGLFDDRNSSFKQKDSVREWCSPRKCYDITEEHETQNTPSDNATKDNENTVEIKENCMQDTPRKSIRINFNATPSKAQINNNECEDTVLNKESNDGNEKHHKKDDLKDTEINKEYYDSDEKHQEMKENRKDTTMNKESHNGDEKHETEDPKAIVDTHDDSSTSTFQLPSEFIAETFSDDSYITFQSPKRKTVEVKQDSSLEISEQDHSVNIDVINIDDSFDISKNSDVKKCSFKFSRLVKEKLENNDVGIDLESFKKGYLSEVDKQYKCSFNHNHNSTNNKSLPNMNLRTVIDFAIDAHMNKEVNNQRKKRKLSEGDVILSFNKNEAKKRKMSENGLVLSFSSDDFEIKKELKTPVKKVESPVKKVHYKTKRIKKTPKYKRRERESKRRYNMSFKEEKIINTTKNENKKVNDEDRSLFDRKPGSKEKSMNDKKNDTGEKLNGSNYDNKSLKKEDMSLLERKETKRNRMKQTFRSNKEIKQLNHEEKRAINEKLDEKSLKERKSDVREKSSKHTIRSHDKNKKQKEKKYLRDIKQDSKEKYVKHKSRSSNEEKTSKDKLRVIDKETDRRKEKHQSNSNKHAKAKNCYSEKHNSDKEKHAKANDNQNIEVTIDSFKSKSNKKTKLSISNSEKDISVKIKWKKKQLRLKIESKKAKAEKLGNDNSKFKQYVLQYFSEVTPKEVLVKPEKDVCPLKRKYVKQEKTHDKFKQMSIQNFFKVKLPAEQED